ncbi:hypothetical protein M5J15_10980 [Serratia symbiotica]|nr:hypothetical protein [Serratia symbiotica]USS95148.1 hypothetical protein M5J15_10980 [Serratia symbiotica]
MTSCAISSPLTAPAAPAAAVATGISGDRTHYRVGHRSAGFVRGQFMDLLCQVWRCRTTRRPGQITPYQPLHRCRRRLNALLDRATCTPLRLRGFVGGRTGE